MPAARLQAEDLGLTAESFAGRALRRTRLKGISIS